jgi:hypothetical protein
MSWDVEIGSRLNELRRKVLQVRIATGIWRMLAWSALAVLIVALAELLFRFDPSIRVPLLLALLLCLVVFVALWVIFPIIANLVKPRTAEDLALAWGYSVQGVNDRLLNALQVFENRRKDRTSPELAEMALATIAHELKDASFEGVLDYRPVTRARTRTVVMGALWVLALIALQNSLPGAFNRLSHPQVDFSPPPPFTLALADVPSLVVRGEPFDVEIEGEGRLPQGVWVAISETGLESREEFAEFDSNGRVAYTLTNPQGDLTLFAHWEKVSSDTASVEVKTRPFIKDLQVRWYPPKYSRLPSGSMAGKRGDVSALKGSRVVIDIEADRSLKSAKFHLHSDADPQNPDRSSMELDVNRASHEFNLLQSGFYNIILEDHDGLISAEPVDYSLWPIPDERPTISIIYPPAEAELNESLLIPLKAGARDDFRISRTRLAYRIVPGGVPDDSDQEGKFEWIKLPFEDLGEGTALVDYLWDLNDLNLLPGDMIQYKLDALDNDRISGPKRAETPLQQLRFPTLEEIFTRMEQGHDDQIDHFQEALERSKLLKEDLEALSEELKRNPDLSWEEKQNVKEMLERQDELANQTQEMAEQLEKMVQKMEENQLFTPETMAKYQELQNLLNEVMTPELMQAMQKLQEALKQQNPENLRRAVEEFSLNQEDFLEKIEKTLNILKQLEMEMRLDELAKRAEELLEKQQEINEALDDSTKKQTGAKEAAEEEQLKREMEAFEREFEEAQELLSESPHNPEETMSQAQELMDENKFPQNMGQMAEDLKQSNRSSAEQRGSQIESGLAQLSEMMRQAKDQLIEGSKNEMAQALQKISHDLLTLSYNQENLLETSSDLDRASPRFRALAQEQQRLRDHLESTAEELFELSQESFFITPKMGGAVQQAFNGMDQAISGYTARAPRSVSRQQEGAMGGLNTAIMEIGQALDQLSRSSSSTGYSEMMEQLAQMAGQQGEINQGTMSLFPGGTNPGQLSLQQQAALSRMAARQQALAQQMESLSQNNQQISEMMGRMGELSKEMQEVADELKNRQIDERTLERQERILRRLLDAQRSVREREYRKERLSRTAEDSWLTVSPDELNLSFSVDEAKEMLLRALKEGYTRDYQQLIRDYFEALAREN